MVVCEHISSACLKHNVNLEVEINNKFILEADLASDDI